MTAVMTKTKDYAAIQSIDELKRLIDVLMADPTKPVGFDIETGYHGPDRPKGALDPNFGFIVGFSITNDPNWARYVPLGHDFAVNLDPEEVWPLMKPVLETLPIVAHNMKFEKRWLRKVGIEINVLTCTMIDAFLLSQWQYVALKKLIYEIFGHQMTELTDLFPDMKGKKLECMRFNVLELNAQTTGYACEDAAWCLAMHLRNSPLVEKMFLRRVELEDMGILCDMEDWGVRLAWDEMRAKAAEAESFMHKMNAEIIADLSAIVGRSLNGININSPNVLKKLLYEEMGLKATRKTKTGGDSTDAVAMAGLAKKVPVVKKILEFREVQALFKRYLDKWPREFSSAPDGRAHPNYKQTVVGTGRLAVDDPSVQQCPKKFHYELNDGTVFEGNFRDFIVADEDHYLLDFDYSQVELRVMAGLSQEPALIEAFNNDRDVHSITASMMLGVPLANVTPDMRDIGKTMNFALLYGMGAGSLADRLAITRERARELYDAYFASFSNITSWMESMKREGRARGYSMSKFGRKYTIWELQSPHMAIYSKGERVCVNAPVQGGAADIMKIAMFRVKKALVKAGWYGTKVRIVLNNHDALTFEVHNSITPQEAEAVIRPAVEFPIEGFPKIVADFAFGPRWGTMQKLKALVEQEEERLTESLQEAPPAPEDDERPDFDDAETVNRLSEAIEAGATDTIAHTGRKLIIELPEMPTQDQFRRFIDLVEANSGPNSIVLHTPAGVVEANWGVSLTLKDQPRISMIFGSATMREPAESIDTGALVADIQL